MKGKNVDLLDCTVVGAVGRVCMFDLLQAIGTGWDVAYEFASPRFDFASVVFKGNRAASPSDMTNGNNSECHVGHMQGIPE